MLPLRKQRKRQVNEMTTVFSKPHALADVPLHYCPGCTHGIVHRLVDDISGVTERDLLVIGRESLTTNGLPGAKGLPKSLRMVVFEQTSK